MFGRICKRPVHDNISKICSFQGRTGLTCIVKMFLFSAKEFSEDKVRITAMENIWGINLKNKYDVEKNMSQQPKTTDWTSLPNVLFDWADNLAMGMIMAISNS